MTTPRRPVRGCADRLVEPTRISDDPGRPDYASRARRARCWSSSRGRPGWGRTRSSTSCAAAKPRRAARRAALRRDRARPGRRGDGEVDGGRLPLRRPATTFLRIWRAARVPRGERGPRQLVRLAARPGPRGAAGRQGRDPQDRRPGRPDGQGAGLRGAADLRHPAVAGDAVRRVCERGRPRPPTSSRSASATRRSSWLARTTTTTSSSTRPARSSAPPSEIEAIIADGARGARGPAGPRLGRRDPRAPARARDGGRGRRPPRATAGDRSSRSRSTRPAPVAPAVHLRRPGRLADLRAMARPCWSSSGGGRRSASSSARPSRAPPASTTKPIVDRVRADGPLLPPLTLALARWIADALPRAAGARHPGDAAAGPARAARARRRADATPTPAGRRRASTTPSTPTCSTSSRRGAAARRAISPHPTVAPGFSAGCAPWPTRGLVALDWTLLGASAGPRYERWIRADGRQGWPLPRARRPASGRPGRPLGPRQVAALEELAAAPDGVGRPGARRPARQRRRSPALVRRGLAEAETRERPRRPLAARTPGRRGGRPPGVRPLTGAGGARSRGSRRRSAPAIRDRSCSMA